MADEVKTEDKAKPSFELDLDKLDAKLPPKQQVSPPDYALDAQAAMAASQKQIEENAYFESLLSRGEFEKQRVLWGLAREAATFFAVGAGAYFFYWLFVGRRS